MTDIANRVGTGSIRALKPACRADESDPSTLGQAEIEEAGHKATLEYNRGVTEDRLGHAKEAAAAYVRATKLNPRLFQAWNNLGLALEELGHLEESTKALQNALVVHRHYPAALRNLARVSLAHGDWATARQCLADLADLEPENWDAQFGKLLLPHAYHSTQEIASVRGSYVSSLEQLVELSRTPQVGNSALRIGALERHSNFFLAYQGENDRDVQRLYAQVVRNLLGDDVPELDSSEQREQSKKLRVAFASCFFRDCTVGHYFKSWITTLDPENFEVWVYLLGGPEDAITAEIQAKAFRTIRATGPLHEVTRTILRDAPNILIYPELGMNGRTNALAALRLAPVQCAAWGHPITSGHPTIDYFISCAVMEPPGAESHYVETLVRLPGLGTRYVKPEVGTSLTRAQLGLPDEAHLYLFPHAPYKVHPENDPIVADILSADPDGLLVMCAGIDQSANSILYARLREELRVRGLPPERLRVLPHLPRPAFLELNRICDLMLDTSHWSGGNTTLDALAAGLPVIARQGAFMRGRQSAGMLQLIGLPELVAANGDAYVANALSLANDSVRRKEISVRIIAGHDLLFDDEKPVAALQKFLLSLPRS